MSLEAFSWRELVQVCAELGIDLGQIKRKPHIIKLLQAEDVSVEEFTEALEEVRKREQEESRKRADEKALEAARWELEKREYKREMERLDYEFEQLELAKKPRELEALCRAATGVEGVTGKACQGREKVGAGDREMTENQRLSPDTTVTILRKTDPKSERRDGESDVAAATELVCQEKKKTEAGDTEGTGNQCVSSDATDAVPRKTVAVLRKPDPNSERRDGESDVEAATEVVCQEKRKTEAGDTEVTGNQRVSSDATDAVPRKTDAVPHKTYPTAELREAESDRDHGKEEKALRASGGDFPDDEGDAKTETTPGRYSQLMESSAEMPEKAVQQSSQDLDRSDRHPCGFGIKPTAPSRKSKRLTRREVIGISFDEIKHTCLVRLRSPDSRPITESGCNKKLDERASSEQLLSRLEEREPKVTHHEEPSIDGGCESDERASRGQLLSRLKEREPEVTQHEEPSTDGGCESTASAEDMDETELDKYQVPCLGHVKISSCLGRSSKEKERKKNQRKGSVLRSGPNTSDKERHRNFGNCTSWKKLSTRRRSRGRGVVQQEKPSTVGDSDQGRPSRNTDEPECYRADPKPVHRETSARLRRGGSKIKNSDAEMGPSSQRTERRRKRLHRIRVLRSDNEASGKKRHLKLGKCTHKKKLSSRRVDGERKDIHRQESSAYNISTSKRVAGDTNESRPDEAGSRQKQPDRRSNSSKRSSKAKKRSQRSSDSTRTSSTRKEEDNSWDAALRAKSSISSRYTGRRIHPFNLPPVITSDLKIKSGLPDCDFKSRIKSSEKDLKSFSGTKDKRGVG